MAFVYKFSAEMTCTNCSDCLNKILQKNKDKGLGITTFNVDLPSKTVSVEGTVTQEEITSILDKSGIKCILLSKDSQ